LGAVRRSARAGPPGRLFLRYRPQACIRGRRLPCRLK